MESGKVALVCKIEWIAAALSWRWNKKLVGKGQQLSDDDEERSLLSRSFEFQACPVWSLKASRASGTDFQSKHLFTCASSLPNESRPIVSFGPEQNTACTLFCSCWQADTNMILNIESHTKHKQRTITKDELQCSTDPQRKTNNANQRSNESNSRQSRHSEFRRNARRTF